MEEYQLIAKQQLEIEDLKERISYFESMIRDVGSIMFNIGSPLNDSHTEYNFEQRKPFRAIARVLEIS